MKYTKKTNSPRGLRVSVSNRDDSRAPLDKSMIRFKKITSSTLISLFLVLIALHPAKVSAPPTTPVPLPNINSQQTAYYDYEGGPRVIRDRYQPEQITKVPINTDLYNCPKLTTQKIGCTFHNEAYVISRNYMLFQDD